MKLGLLMNSDTLICIWILVIPISIIEVSTTRKWVFFNLFQFLARLRTSKHLNLFRTYHVRRNGTMWKTCFSTAQNARKKISWNKKTKGVKITYWQLGLRVWRIILAIKGWAHKRQTFTLISIKIMRILNFF